MTLRQGPVSTHRCVLVGDADAVYNLIIGHLCLATATRVYAWGTSLDINPWPYVTLFKPFFNYLHAPLCFVVTGTGSLVTRANLRNQLQETHVV